jgi:hypothetical protein
MRTSLERNIQNALRVESPTSLVDTDSEANPNGHQFPAIHFDYYARNGTRVSSPLNKLNLLISYFLSREIQHHQTSIHFSYNERESPGLIIISYSQEFLKNL